MNIIFIAVFYTCLFDKVFAKNCLVYERTLSAACGETAGFADHYKYSWQNLTKNFIEKKQNNVRIF